MLHSLYDVRGIIARDVVALVATFAFVACFTLVMIVVADHGVKR